MASDKSKKKKPTKPVDPIDNKKPGIDKKGGGYQPPKDPP